MGIRLSSELDEFELGREVQTASDANLSGLHVGGEPDLRGEPPVTGA